MAVLESLGCAYHLLAIHDALRADNTIEIEKVDRSSLYKAREDADVQPICIWGLYSFSLEKKPFSKAGTQVFFCNYYHDLWAVFEKWACFADLLSEAFKKDI